MLITLKDVGKWTERVSSVVGINNHNNRQKRQEMKWTTAVTTGPGREHKPTKVEKDKLV